MPVHFRLFWTGLDHFWTVVCHFRPFRTVSDRFRTVSDRFGQFQTVLDCFGQFKPFRTVSDCFGPFRTLFGLYQTFWTILNHCRPFRTILNRFIPFQSVSEHLELKYIILAIHGFQIETRISEHCRWDFYTKVNKQEKLKPGMSSPGAKQHGDGPTNRLTKRVIEALCSRLKTF
jgi:hypothetical protein